MRVKEEIENSHAGVAIPIDEEALEMEETTKKLNFYKIERPTTNSGLSTWILLSGQTSPTTKPPSTRKPIIKPILEEKLHQNLTTVAVESHDKPIRIIKPIFKQRPSTTTKPVTTTKSVVSTSKEPTTTTSKTTTQLTKIKASVLNKRLNATTATTTEQPITTTHLIVKKPSPSAVENTTAVSAVDSSALPLENKTDDVDLPNTDNKKKKTSTKRKKNKTRRRKPGTKDGNSTSVSKPPKASKENPISTEIYNYLAREVMPTVGVGLVGLMAAAGLAGYFLYPFGAARRNYVIDRKDTEGSYYYNDDYSGGMPEEEAIGKVIAGMPGNSLFENSYKSPTSRNAYVNTKYKLSDRRVEIQQNPYGGAVQGTVEDVPLSSLKQEENLYENQGYQGSSNFEPISYSDTRYDQKFVVGNVPKDAVAEVTPAAVPEHGPRNINFQTNYAEVPTFFFGNPQDEELKYDTKTGTVPAQKPRSLKVRKKRSEMSNDVDNEIVPTTEKVEVTTAEAKNATSSTEKPEVTTAATQTSTGIPEKINSFIDIIRELIHIKARIGLQFIQNATQSISNYISKVQSRLDQQYREYSKNKH
ncbi:hypothetical protein NQ315_007709 [Exocentrus adspersus]|uniref:Uncharacterized protein n=1 Tax=Exocentrus adspersus TaxID=1586481 RepID=A0AAV8W8N9_9CUCU|nr:hypothetical protein NQ315_007709 [Exocentrus adspersus]